MLGGPEDKTLNLTSSSSKHIFVAGIHQRVPNQGQRPLSQQKRDPLQQYTHDNSMLETSPVRRQYYQQNQLEHQQFATVQQSPLGR